jgi:hypothetical protein
MPKKEIRKIKVTRKNEDGTAAAVVSTMQTAPPSPTLSREESERDMAEVEVAEHEEFQEMKRKEAFSKTHHDPLTMYLSEKYKAKNLFPAMVHSDSRFPIDSEGHRMKVTRYYAALHLIFDILPKTWTPEMALAKKWAIENIPSAGFRYTWKIDGEKFTDEQGIMKPGQMPEALIWEREKPLKKEPEYKFIYIRPMQQFAFGGRVTVG